MPDDFPYDFVYRRHTSSKSDEKPHRKVTKITIDERPVPNVGENPTIRANIAPPPRVKRGHVRSK